MAAVVVFSMASTTTLFRLAPQTGSPVVANHPSFWCKGLALDSDNQCHLIFYDCGSVLTISSDGATSKWSATGLGDDDDENMHMTGLQPGPSEQVVVSAGPELKEVHTVGPSSSLSSILKIDYRAHDIDQFCFTDQCDVIASCSRDEGPASILKIYPSLESSSLLHVLEEDDHVRSLAYYKVNFRY